MPALLDVDSTVQPGHVLDGKYRVERVLGMGGMGVVVAARHVVLNTSFALKLMRREATKEDESVERFLREARAAVRLKSQHCVRVIDVGRLQDGAPYMVMELLVGQDLADLVGEKGARSPPEAVDYILQACEGIAEAHALGLVHRDIKPQNLFVTRGLDGMPLVKVLDFGLAKSIKSTPEVRSLTHTTAVMGSPVYMSPEQMRASRDLDARSDLWSLAVVLYELLTGRTPFEGATLPELCSSVLNEAPAPMPSDIPRGLMRVIVRCLQKDPRRRYADVAELAVALEEFASAPGAAARIRAVLDTPRTDLEPHPGLVADPDADTKTAASIDTTQRVVRRWRQEGRRARWPSLLAVCVGIAGGAGLGFALLKPSASHPSPSPTPAAAAVAPAENVPAPPVVASIVAAQSAPPPAPAVAPDPSTSKLGPARAAPARHASPPTATTVAQPKPGGPVLVPKTTEF
jgi:eukaryotic-like serine/threonine-protein kinase